MRVNLLNSTVTPTGGFTTTGGTLTGPLTLHGNPTAPLHAATRDYVDTAIAGRAPLAHNHTLANITDWPSVVTGSEVGHLDGVNSNIQIQINNRLPLSGGVLTGALTLAGDPTLTNHAATRSYVDTIAAEARLVKVGVVLSLPQDTAPVGFLRANGAAVSQSTFSSLFSVVGHRFAEEVSTASTFTTNAALGAGAPWTQQFGFNNATELGTFVSDGTLPVNLHGSSAIVTSSRVFLLGGSTGSATINTIFSAVIQANGTLGVFTAVGTLPVNLFASSAIVTSSRVFLLGGSNGAATINTIFSAVIQADGTLSVFTSVGTLPVNLHGSSAIVTSSRVFLLGGNNGAAVINTIFSAVIQADGTLGVFTAIGTLPVNLHYSSAIVASSRVFLLGGHNGAAVINTIHSAVIQADGTLGAFTAVGTLPVNVHASSAIVTSSRVFLLGGSNGAAAINTIHSAVIQTDGTLSAFTAIGTLPVNLVHSSAIVTSSRVFLLGGWTGSSSINTINTIFSTPLIGGSGLNDYSRFYNGSINIFNGAPLSGAIVVFTRNPDRNTLFMLPNESAMEALSPGMNRFIKAS